MKNKSNESFLELFYSNDQNKMREYLLKSGKKPKPICPLIFLPKEQEDNSK